MNLVSKIGRNLRNWEGTEIERNVPEQRKQVKYLFFSSRIESWSMIESFLRNGLQEDERNNLPPEYKSLFLGSMKNDEWAITRTFDGLQYALSCLTRDDFEIYRQDFIDGKKQWIFPEKIIVTGSVRQYDDFTGSGMTVNPGIQSLRDILEKNYNVPPERIVGIEPLKFALQHDSKKLE